MAAKITAVPKFVIESENDTLTVYKEDELFIVDSSMRGTSIDLTQEEAEAVCSCIMSLVGDN